MVYTTQIIDPETKIQKFSSGEGMLAPDPLARNYLCQLQ